MDSFQDTVLVFQRRIQFPKRHFEVRIGIRNALDHVIKCDPLNDPILMRIEPARLAIDVADLAESIDVLRVMGNLASYDIGMDSRIHRSVLAEHPMVHVALTGQGCLSLAFHAPPTVTRPLRPADNPIVTVQWIPTP